MSADLEVYPDRRALVEAACGWIERVLREETAVGETLSVALAGGSTPEPVYEALAARHREEPLPLDRVALFFGDERCVPPDSPDSNYAMVRRALLDPVGEDAFAAVHRMRGEADDPDAEAERYAALVPDELDLVILGAGEDGHTASLFPRHAALMEVERKVVAVEGPKPPPRRLTLTPAALVAAHRILVLASGEGKAAAIARALDGPADPHATPIQLALPTDPAKVRSWLLDSAAAERL